MRIFNVRYTRRGGMTFLRVGRLQFSFCLCHTFAPPRNQRARRLGQLLQSMPLSASRSVAVCRLRAAFRSDPAA